MYYMSTVDLHIAERVRAYPEREILVLRIKAFLLAKPQTEEPYAGNLLVRVCGGAGR